MEVINVCSQISLGLKLSTFTMSFSITVLPPLNKEQKITFLLLLHPKHGQVQTCRFLLSFRALNSTGLTWNKQNICSLVWPLMGFSWRGSGRWAGFTFSLSAPLDVIPTKFFQLFPPNVGRAWYPLRQAVKTIRLEYRVKAFVPIPTRQCRHRCSI